MTRKHLDLGSGFNPRNPYDANDLYGIDIMEQESTHSFKYTRSNLATQNIPFPDNYFDSISAYDFFEHIPRIRIYDDDRMTFPFIDLMNEIYRVLKIKGKLFAVTPYYPKEEAFVDPTHVNIITKETHQYFCGDDSYGRYYGFKGNFCVLRAHPISTKLAKKGATVNVLQRIYEIKRKLSGRQTHFLWELEAIK